MVAGMLDIGFMGIPPFLIGADRGMEWKIFTALSRMPMGLVTLDPSLTRFQDLDRGARIAVPQPGSIQHILIAMAAERLHGDAGFHDDRLVSMSHPDATQALIGGSRIAAYLAPPPFLSRLTELPGARVLLTGEEAFDGPFTFIVGVVASPVRDGTSEGAATDAVRRALVRAIDALETDPEAVAETASEYGLEAAELERHLAAEGVVYGGDVVGLDRFIDFMTRVGYLRADVPREAGRYLTTDEGRME
jgi:NitT/TauT family transport system substrate-binding protein